MERKQQRKRKKNAKKNRRRQKEDRTNDRKPFKIRRGCEPTKERRFPNEEGLLKIPACMH